MIEEAGCNKEALRGDGSTPLLVASKYVGLPPDLHTYDGMFTEDVFVLRDFIGWDN